MRLAQPAFALLLLSALAVTATPSTAAGATSPAAPAVDPMLLAGMKARSIGPAGMSGRVAAIDALESDPDRVFVGAATGGLFGSDNGGMTWKSLFDEEKVAAIGAVAVNQKNPAILWVGTGEGNVRNSASVGNGVYRSLDGGVTWSHLGLDATERIYRILLHPDEPDTAWVCALGREWGENPERGVFRTRDGGKSWAKVLYVDDKTGCGDLALDPSNPQKLIASMWQFRRWPHFFRSGGPGSGLHVSWDGGTTWKRLQEEDGLPPGELGRIGLAFARSNPQIVYALVEATKSALLRSEDGGRSFKSVNEEPNVAPRPFYFGDLRVDPRNPDRLYSLDYTVRISEDAGRHFRPRVRWDEIHGDHHAMWIDPANPEHFYVGNDGGVAVTHDGGRNNWFIANLPLAQFYHVAVDAAVPYNVYGGLQDNGSWRGPSTVWRRGGIRNHEWVTVGEGDGFDTLPDPFDATIGDSLSQGGYLMRWNLATGEMREIRPAPEGEVRLRFNWNAGLAVDPLEAGVVYLGSQFLHRSTDRGETWTTVSPDLTTNNPEWQKQDESGGLTRDVTAAENFTTIVAIAPSPIERGTIWVGTDDGRVQVTRDGGRSWTSVESNLPGVPAGTWVPHITPSRHAAGTAFAVFDNHRRSDWTPYVARTDDYGKSWKSLATPELWGYALAIEQDPVAPDLLYLGTEFGLWISLDGGRRWMKWTHGLPTVSVMDLVVHPREHDLVIATHGRALWVLDDIRPLRELSAATLAEPLHLFPIADAQQFWQAPEAGGFGFGAGEFRGTNRPYGALVTFSLAGDDLPLPDVERERERQERLRREKAAAVAVGTPPPPAAGTADQPATKPEDEKVTIVVSDASGRAIRTLRVRAMRGVHRVAWDLGRDGWKELPRDPAFEGEPDENRGGPEVPPGSYSVTVKFRGQEASRPVRVLADPRSHNSAADWASRWAAIERAGALRETATDAVVRLRRTRADIDAVTERVKRVHEEKLRRHELKPEELPLAKSGTALREKLDALEKRLWQSPESVGILADRDVMSKVGTAMSQLGSSWSPPSPTQLATLARARTELEAFLVDLNRTFAEDVTAYRREVEAAGIGLFPAASPLTVTP